MATATTPPRRLGGAADATDVTGSPRRGLSENLREALSSMTTRGRALLAGGAAAFASGAALGEADLLRIGLIVALLPPIAAIWIAAKPARLSATRELSSTRLHAGQRGTAALEIVNLNLTSTPPLLIEDRLPWALGTQPRFAIGAARPRRASRWQYPIGSDQRGRYRIGPLDALIRDPLGLIEIRRRFDLITEVTVVPTVEQLPSVELRGDWSGSGEQRPHPQASGSPADVTVRDYRQGDELRRVHWPSTARTGRLIVRAEEQPWHSRCTLLVDNRAAAHAGHGAESSLERAISVAASIALHLTERGFQVRVATAHGAKAAGAGHEAAEDHDPGAVLDRLAVLGPTSSPRLDASWADDTVAEGMLIAIMGRLDDLDLAMLEKLHHQGNTTLAITLDTATWQQPGSPESSAPALRRRGWRAVSLQRGAPLGPRWQELGR